MKILLIILILIVGCTPIIPAGNINHYWERNDTLCNVYCINDVNLFECQKYEYHYTFNGTAENMTGAICNCSLIGCIK